MKFTTDALGNYRMAPVGETSVRITALHERRAELEALLKERPHTMAEMTELEALGNLMDAPPVVPEKESK